MKERDHLGDPGVDWRIILRYPYLYYPPIYVWVCQMVSFLQEVVCGIWAGSSWLRIETGGRHL